MPRDHCRDWLNRYIVKTADDFRFDDSAGTPRTLWILGSRSCQPVGLGSLLRPAIRDHGDNSRKNIAGRLAACAPRNWDSNASAGLAASRSASSMWSMPCDYCREVFNKSIFPNLRTTVLRLHFPGGDKPDLPRRHMTTPSRDTAVLQEDDSVEEAASM